MDTDTPAPDDELESALTTALGDEPRSDELHAMKRALLGRRDQIISDIDTEEDAAQRALLEARLEELEEQIGVLGEEADITKFVEDAVRVGLEMRKLESG